MLLNLVVDPRGSSLRRAAILRSSASVHISVEKPRRNGDPRLSYFCTLGQLPPIAILKV